MGIFSRFKSLLSGTSKAFTAEEKAGFAGLDERIVIGQIREIRLHNDPKVTKVRVTHTDIGGEIVQILCGAPNIQVGMIVPVATIGTDLGEGFVISQRNIRGEDSHGMICSKSELGLPDDGVDGIWPLCDCLKKKIGTPLRSFAE